MTAQHNLDRALRRAAARLLSDLQAVQPRTVGPLAASAPAVRLVRRPVPLRCRVGLHRWHWVTTWSTEPPHIGWTVARCSECPAARR